MGSDQPILRMEKIDKRFPGVHALENVDFDLYAGEVHILLGENGAGKSTLIKVLSGSVPPDSGRIFLEGKEVHVHSPETAQALGIGMVYQEFSLVPSLTVAENIFLGRPPKTRLGTVHWREMLRQAEESLRQVGVAIDPRTPVRDLSVAEQQLTEIARILTRQLRILLLDEPTSALSDAERERLFEIIRGLQGRGVATVYISHRLAEVPLIGQRVTVLRDGKWIGTMPVAEAAEERLVQMMVGRHLADQYPKHGAERGRAVLRVARLSVPEVLHELSFELREGEILGIFGLMGAGQTELVRAIFGLEPGGTGEIFIDEAPTQIAHPADAIRYGVGYLPRDRKEGLVPVLPIPPNITLGRVSQYSPARLLNLRDEQELATKYVDDLRIHPATLTRPVVFLSGGNQQKVVLSRWLASGTKILLLDDPTRGIDVGAKAEVFALMDHLAQEGVGIVFISSEMQELLSMADRILVMRDGRFTAEYASGQASQEDLLRSAS